MMHRRRRDGVEPDRCNHDQGDEHECGGWMRSPYKGAIDSAMKTIKAEVPLALYNGFVPQFRGKGAFTVVLFMTLEQVGKLLPDI
ncbi:hypothetical protein MLD38_022941 [Melastoma candidum]|uniref:Uncharacterized protein n=1 Tax=Melastoma candidum TaxID=119954 RepID=A0ACB9QPW5_9MYRT|nr:hypothetical protein MLD38_022941 [Melastoma candidum]